MIKKIFLIYLLILSACKSEKPKEEYSPPGKKDINEIVRAIIYQDSLYKKKIPLSVDLVKITVSLKDPAIPSRRSFDTMNVKRLLGRGHNGQFFFSKSDSSYFLLQNGAIKSLKLDSPFLKIITLISKAQLQKNEKSDPLFRHYDLSLPLFSLDRKKAVVEFNYYCTFCGFGMLIYLERINGKWEIIKQEETWVS